MADDDRSLTPLQAVGVYLATVAVALTGMVVLGQWLAISALRCGALVLGVIYLIAAAQRPWHLFWVIRNHPLFTLIDDDQMARILMLAIAAGAFAFAIFGHPR
jgi:hypothetical protein